MYATSLNIADFAPSNNVGIRLSILKTASKILQHLHLSFRTKFLETQLLKITKRISQTGLRGIEAAKNFRPNEAKERLPEIEKVLRQILGYHNMLEQVNFSNNRTIRQYSEQAVQAFFEMENIARKTAFENNTIDASWEDEKELIEFAQAISLNSIPIDDVSSGGCS